MTRTKREQKEGIRKKSRKRRKKKKNKMEKIRTKGRTKIKALK